MSRADHLKECDCFGVCYILPNQQIFVDLLFFHQWQNFFAGRSLETLGLANAVGCKFHLARQMCLFLVGVSCLRDCTCNKRNRKKTNRQPSCLLANTKKNNETKACKEWIHVGYTGRKIIWTEKVQFHTMQWDSLHIIEPKPGWLQLSSTPQEQAFDLSWVTASCTELSGLASIWKKQQLCC